MFRIDGERRRLLEDVTSELHENASFLHRLFESLVRLSDESQLRFITHTVQDLKAQQPRVGDKRQEPRSGQQQRPNKRHKPAVVASTSSSNDSSSSGGVRSAVVRFFNSEDLLSSLFTFLDLASHHALARTSRRLMDDGTVAMPLVVCSNKPAAWRKPVVLPPSTTNLQLQRICSYACLTWLDLRGCSENVTDTSLLFLQHLPLQHLNLSYCSEITDAGLLHLKQLPLQHLNLAYCSKITDGGLLHLKQLPLQHLNLSWLQ
jgi:hypothetical protein